MRTSSFDLMRLIPALCRFEWKLTNRTLPFLQHGSFSGRNRNGLFAAVKGGQSPAQRTLDGIEKSFTLKGLGLHAGVGIRPASPSGGKEFPATRGRARGVGNPHILATSRFRCYVKFHSKRHSALIRRMGASEVK